MLLKRVRLIPMNTASLSAHKHAAPISRRSLLGALAAGSLLPTRWASAQSAGAAPKLRLIGHTTLPHKLQFQDTTVGGLSGLDYDRERGVYYALSDDRSDINPARFYTLKLPLTASSLGAPELLSVTTLLAPNGKPYPNKRTVKTDSADSPDVPDVPDGESIRLRRATNTLYWTSEGDAARGTPAFVREQRLDGSYSSQVPVPAIFAFDKDGKKGLRDNKTFEGMGFTPSGDTLWLAMEGALMQDGPLPTVGILGVASGPIRLTQFASHSGQPFRQIAYIPDAIPAVPTVLGITTPLPEALGDNGISEIWMASETGMLVLERAWAYGVGNSLRLYWIDTEDADDVINLPTLAGAKFKPADKVLLLDFAQLGLPHLDNIEGMTRGPTLPNGNPTLVFVSDDNFSSSQVTQFVALEWTL
jgi:hypothetical protein